MCDPSGKPRGAVRGPTVGEKRGEGKAHQEGRTDRAWKGTKKKKIKENLELSDQDSNSKKTVQRTALLSNPNFRARKT